MPIYKFEATLVVEADNAGKLEDAMWDFQTYASMSGVSVEELIPYATNPTDPEED